MSIRALASLVRLLAQGHGKAFSIPTHLTWHERIRLYETAMDIGTGQAIVEIGSYLGASSSFLAAAMKESGGRLYCVDTWQNQGMSEGPRDTYAAFLANTAVFRETIVPLRMRSEEAAGQVPDGIALLFVDGDHSFEGVSRDLHRWLPKLRTNAWLLLHDAGWAEGVQRAIREIVVPLQSGPPRSLPNLCVTRVNPWRIPRREGQALPR